MRGILLGCALLAAGCVTRSGKPPEAPPGFVLECDRAKVMVPAGESPGPAGAREFTRQGIAIRTREDPVSVEAAGEDFSVVAEGTVLLLSTVAGRTFEEGPFRTVVIRNGMVIRR